MTNDIVPRMAALEERLSRLDTQNRRLRIVAAAGLAGLLGVVPLPGFAVPVGSAVPGQSSDELQRNRLHLAVGRQGLDTISLTGTEGTIDAGLGIDAERGPWLRPVAAAATGGERVR
ncbi:MAG: hypothetical protein IPM29_31045 [Planctomycetes bacterium]|nr:hypothetical protein [Planctomycetota bacterium]